MGVTPLAVLMTRPSRMISTVTRSVASQPLVDTKSRDGKAVIEIGATGGSLTMTLAAGRTSAVAEMASETAERLPTASAASTV